MGQRTSDTVNRKSPSMFGSTGVAESPATGTEITEVSESTNLSPLMADTLKLQDRSESNMGIETTWTDANGPTSECAIPLSTGQTNEFTDVGADPIGSDTGIEHGPFPPSSSTQNNHFETGDIQHDSSMETETNIPGVCGLENLGNTCFMAAGLQCLTATPPVVQHFLKLQEQRGEKFLPSGTLMDHFSELLGKIWCGKYKVVKPIEFKNTLGAYHTQFKDYRQHDCQEFLALLLDSLHEQMNMAKIGKNSNISANSTTANMLNSIEHQDTKLHLPGSAITATHKSNYNINSSYDRSPSPGYSNSPMFTMPGSPRDSPTGDLDSAANSLRNSPVNDPEDDEETLDSDETAEPRSDYFIHNRMDEDQSFRRQQDDDIHGITCSLYESTKPMMGFSKRFPSPQYSFHDIIKEAKTSNANFSVPPQECNNEIHYDSRKFPKENVRRTPLDNSNLTENHDFDNKSVSVKRIKEVNVLQKMNHSSTEFGIDGFSDTDTELEKCNVKRMRLDDHMSCSGGSKISQYNGAVADQKEIEADEHWVKHLQSNHSIIVDTFQGQFKSTVVCAVCKHVSVTYEPFMYLSVPLPHAMERQLTVTYVPTFGKDPIKCIVSMNKQLGIGKFKEELLKTLSKEDVLLTKVAIAEVLNNHIARILDDNTLLRDVNDTNRSIYAFELTDPPEPYNTALDERGDQCMVDTEPLPTPSTTDTSQCTICLSDDLDLQRLEGGHLHNKCDVIMCDDCLMNYCNKEETVKCVICHQSCPTPRWIKINQSRLRILNVPVIFRHDSINETTNNRKTNVLYGHPLLLRLPSRVNAKDLYEVIAKNVPGENNYTIHFVEGQGQRCSRCMWPKCCTGCHIPKTGEVVLSGNDTIAVRYMGGQIPKIGQPIDHISVNKQRPPHPLSLHDCLQAFSQSETLDEHNPWFCPKCECNRCATKTLTVHRYPKFLIVYLKRFVFYESTSMKLDNKVIFPLDNLSVGQHLYDLYACVCHFGGVSAGHYTAYAKNPNTDEWFYYNDDHVTCRQTPQDDDFSNAYILFYRRQGTNFKPCNT